MEGSREYFERGGYPGADCNLYVPNRRVACSPFQAKSVEVKIKNAFATVSQKTELTQMEVVFGNERYRPGTFVYVKGDVLTLPWTREVFELAGKKFVMVPEDLIQLVELKVAGDTGGFTVSHGC